MKQGTTGRRKTTRQQFLVEVAGMASSLPGLAAQSPSERPKVLAVVAHPDDEYAFATFAYRLTREVRGTPEQVIITNGEAGFRYSQLAEAFYGLRLTDESAGRDRLPAIRRQEAERAGQIPGIRRHWFLEQRDPRFTLDSREAFSGVWDTRYVTEFITTKLKQEQYDFVMIMLPTEQTHGRHQAAALITAEAICRLPLDRRPVLIAAEASAAEPPAFRARPEYPVLRSHQAPRWRVNRLDPLPDQPSLNYNVVVKLGHRGTQVTRPVSDGGREAYVRELLVVRHGYAGRCAKGGRSVCLAENQIRSHLRALVPGTYHVEAGAQGSTAWREKEP